MTVLWTILVMLVSLIVGMLLGMVHNYFRRRELIGGQPLGLTLIAIFEIIVGLLLSTLFAFAMVAFFSRYPELKVKMQPFGMRPEELVVRILIASVLALVAGVGLWRGTPWGWEIATFAVACALSLNALSLAFDGVSMARPRRSGSLFLLLRIGIGVVILKYLYRPKIRRFCLRDVDGMRHAGKLLWSVLTNMVLEFGLRMLLV